MATDHAASPLAVVIVGHVDHGKSTLIGRLFHDAGVLPDGRVAQLSAAADRRGVAFEFANLTDALQAERDQNVTIDTTQILFRQHGREIRFIDAPGHREFIKHMVTGASQADAALLVIDAVDGVSDQTRRHALLLTILGISRVIVIINKIDLIDAADRPSRFNTIAAAATGALVSLKLTPLDVIPAASAPGWNIVNRTNELSWHNGRTVAEAVLALAPDRTRPHPTAPGLVFSVQDVYRRDTHRWIVGRAESGIVVAGDRVVVLPSGHPATIDQVGPDAALTIREPLFVSRGDVLAAPDAPLVVSNTLHARIFWLGREPLTMNRRYEIRLGTQQTQAEVVSIARVIDASLLIDRDDRSRVPASDVADVEWRLTRPLVVDPTGETRSLSRLVVVDRQPAPNIVGGGVVFQATPQEARAQTPPATARVTAAERHARLGHRGAVVWLTGLSGAGKSTLADGLERALFDRGLTAAVLDGDRVRFGLNADLGFSAEDRRENIRRVAEAAKLFAEQGTIAITAFISPSAADRHHAREIISGSTALPFIEVFVDAELSVCESRDPKGLYRKARAGEIAEFTGVSAPYDVPGAPDVVIKTSEDRPEACVARLMETVLAVVQKTV